MLYNPPMFETELITSRNNPLIKQARSLRQRKARAETGFFLVEGIHRVGAAVEADWDVKTLLYAPDLLTSEYAHDLIVSSTDAGIRCQSVSADVFTSIAGKDNPQGIMAVVQQRQYSLSDLSSENFKRGAAVVSPQDPGNIGTILRTIDASGADALIVLDGGVDIYHPKVVRASMGALFWKPVVRTTFDEFSKWTQRNEHRVLGTSAKGTENYASLDLRDASWVLLLGSEQKGLSPEQIALCDSLVALPMRGRGTSLNLAVAAGILLYALTE